MHESKLAVVSRLGADGVDAGVGAAAVGQLLDPLVDILLHEIEDARRRPPAPCARRSGTVSMAMTRSAPSRKALRMANCPTGPQPQIAIVSPAWMLQNSAAM